MEALTISSILLNLLLHLFNNWPLHPKLSKKLKIHSQLYLTKLKRLLQVILAPSNQVTTTPIRSVIKRPKKSSSLWEIVKQSHLMISLTIMKKIKKLKTSLKNSKVVGQLKSPLIWCSAEHQTQNHKQVAWLVPWRAIWWVVPQTQVLTVITSTRSKQNSMLQTQQKKPPN